jgi:hypothetical protein
VNPNFRTNRGRAGRLVAAAALAACAACSAEARNSFSQMGDWIAQDARSFGSDVTNAPQWMSGQFANQTADLHGSVTFVTQELGKNVKATSENVTGAPAWLANQTNKDIAGFRDTTGVMGTIIATNAKTTYNDSILGAPEWIANQTKSQMRDLSNGWNSIWDMFLQTYNNFWKNVSTTFELMLVK